MSDNELRQRIEKWLFSPKWTDTHTEFDEISAIEEFVSSEVTQALFDADNEAGRAAKRSGEGCSAQGGGRVHTERSIIHRITRRHHQGSAGITLSLNQKRESETPWIVYDGVDDSIAVCTRCNAYLRVDLPMEVHKFIAISDRFIKKHSKCLAKVEKSDFKND